MTHTDPANGLERIAPPQRYPILYVDDEPENLLVFRATFSDEFKVLTAQSAEEALMLLGSQPVAVLVTDQRMPHMSGIDLCHRVWEWLPSVRRVLLTAYSDHKTAIEAINRGGVHGYLEKPWDALTMRRALWDAVNRVHLDRTVSELRSALAERELRLEKAKARERLLHDVGNATTRLTLSVRTLRKVVDGKYPGLPAAAREELAHEVDALERTTEHLVRLQHERMSDKPFGELRPDRLRVDELLSTVGALAGFAPGGGLRLHLEAPPGLDVWGDRLSVTRILVNLVQNARQALESGGAAPGEPGEVTVRVRRTSDALAIEVSDNGPGVPAELRARIFEEFFTTRSERGGTGLGLASARELARLSGGDLALPEPQPARGALFRLTLPAKGPA